MLHCFAPLLFCVYRISQMGNCLGVHLTGLDYFSHTVFNFYNALKSILREIQEQVNVNKHETGPALVQFVKPLIKWHICYRHDKQLANCLSQLFSHCLVFYIPQSHCTMADTRTWEELNSVLP